MCNPTHCRFHEEEVGVPPIVKRTRRRTTAASSSSATTATSVTSTVMETVRVTAAALMTPSSRGGAGGTASRSPSPLPVLPSRHIVVGEEPSTKRQNMVVQRQQQQQQWQTKGGSNSWWKSSKIFLSIWSMIAMVMNLYHILDASSWWGIHNQNWRRMATTTTSYTNYYNYLDLSVDSSSSAGSSSNNSHHDSCSFREYGWSQYYTHTFLSFQEEGGDEEGTADHQGPRNNRDHFLAKANYLYGKLPFLLKPSNKITFWGAERSEGGGKICDPATGGNDGVSFADGTNPSILSVSRLQRHLPPNHALLQLIQQLEQHSSTSTTNKNPVAFVGTLLYKRPEAMQCYYGGGYNGYNQFRQQQENYYKYQQGTWLTLLDAHGTILWKKPIPLTPKLIEKAQTLQQQQQQQQTLLGKSQSHSSQLQPQIINSTIVHTIHHTNIASMDNPNNMGPHTRDIFDDPRLFLHDGQLWISYNDNNDNPAPTQSHNIIHFQNHVQHQQTHHTQTQEATTTNTISTSTSIFLRDEETIPSCCGKNIGVLEQQLDHHHNKDGYDNNSLPPSPISLLSWIDPVTVIHASTTTTTTTTDTAAAAARPHQEEANDNHRNATTTTATATAGIQETMEDIVEVDDHNASSSSSSSHHRNNHTISQLLLPPPSSSSTKTTFTTTSSSSWKEQVGASMMAEKRNSGFHGSNGFLLRLPPTPNSTTTTNGQEDAVVYLGIGHYRKGTKAPHAVWGHHYTHAFYTIAATSTAASKVNDTTVTDFSAAAAAANRPAATTSTTTMTTNHHQQHRLKQNQQQQHQQQQPKYKLTGLSPEFVFPSKSSRPEHQLDGEVIQFASGMELVRHNDEDFVVIAYGINDCESAIIYIELSRVLNLLQPVVSSSGGSSSSSSHKLDDGSTSYTAGGTTMNSAGTDLGLQVADFVMKLTS